MPDLRDETQVLYVSPLRALSNDVQKNLQGPLAEIAAREPFLPEVRVLVRTGETTPAKLAAWPDEQKRFLIARGVDELLDWLRDM